MSVGSSSCLIDRSSASFLVDAQRASARRSVQTRKCKVEVVVGVLPNVNRSNFPLSHSVP